MTRSSIKNVALIIAHPDDETLWAGGTILIHPGWNCYIVCLSRSSDSDRAPKFYKALGILKSEGIMGDLDDGPDQELLDSSDIENCITNLLPAQHFDLLITHNPSGEYTRHKRHEEVSKAVIKLWNAGKINTRELRTFAFEDGNKRYYPRPVQNAPLFQLLPENIWLKKYSIITETYGFEKSSWEAMTTPKAEAFWQFKNPQEARKWMEQFQKKEV